MQSPESVGRIDTSVRDKPPHSSGIRYLAHWHACCGEASGRTLSRARQIMNVLHQLVGMFAALAFAVPASAALVLYSAAGVNSAGIQGQVDAFRADLGTLNANVIGSFGSGRREINWDGVPD